MDQTFFWTYNFLTHNTNIFWTKNCESNIQIFLNPSFGSKKIFRPQKIFLTQIFLFSCPNLFQTQFLFRQIFLDSNFIDPIFFYQTFLRPTFCNKIFWTQKLLEPDIFLDRHFFLPTILFNKKYFEPKNFDTKIVNQTLFWTQNFLLTKNFRLAFLIKNVIEPSFWIQNFCRSKKFSLIIILNINCVGPQIIFCP